MSRLCVRFVVVCRGFCHTSTWKLFSSGLEVHPHLHDLSLHTLTCVTHASTSQGHIDAPETSPRSRKTVCAFSSSPTRSASASRATCEVVEAHRKRRQMRPSHTPVQGQASCSLARGSPSSLEAAAATASAVPASVAADEATQPKPGAVSSP